MLSELRSLLPRRRRSWSETAAASLAFVAKERVDGKLILTEAVQVLKMKGNAAQG